MDKRILSGLLALIMLVLLFPVNTLADDSVFTIESNGILTKYNGSGGDVTIPSDVTSIGADVFRNCSSLTSAIIPNSVTSIGAGAFSGCSSLTSVKIPNSVTIIKNAAFKDCSSLLSIMIPDSVTSIGYGAFDGCSSLMNATIPSGITYIDVWTFRGCSSLVSVIIPESVTEIRQSAFEECSQLLSVGFPADITRIGTQAFYRCDNLKDVYYSGTATHWNEIQIDNYNTSLVNATIHHNGESSTFYSPTNPYIVQRVRSFTSHDASDIIQDEIDNIYQTYTSNEDVYAHLVALFQEYGFETVSDGMSYLTYTYRDRTAYKSLTTDQMYTAYQFYTDMNDPINWFKRSVLAGSSIIFNSELTAYLNPLNITDVENYPCLARNIELLYDYMEAPEVEITATRYVDSINDIMKKSGKITSVGSAYANQLIKNLNNCETIEEINNTITSINRQGVFQNFSSGTDENGETVFSFSLSEDSGFGQFAKAMGKASKVFNIVNVPFDFAFDIMSVDAKFAVYSQYTGFLTEVSNASDLPWDMRVAAEIILNRIKDENGDFGAIEDLGNKIFGLIDDGNISKAIWQNALGETTHELISESLSTIRLASWFVNQISGVDTTLKRAAYVEGYAQLCAHFKSELERSKTAFVQNPTETNAWAFYDKYTTLYNLRLKGEKMYLKMSKTEGIVSYFVDENEKTVGQEPDDNETAFERRARVVNDNVDMLQTKCTFNLKDEIWSPDSWVPEAQKILLTSILFAADTWTTNVGDITTITPAFLPLNATNKTVEWLSSNPAVARVDNGVVTSVSDGEAVVYCISSENNRIYDFCVFKVNAETFPVSCTAAKGSASYKEGQVVTVLADDAPVGKQFAGWDGLDKLELVSGNCTDVLISFIMPGEPVTVTAVYEDAVTIAPSIIGEVSGSTIIYTATNVPDGAILIAARYENGRMTDLQIISSVKESDTLTMKGTGTQYKLFLVNQSYIPLCASWSYC